MALYDGVNGVARRVTKFYDGVRGVARKVTRAYIGVNGVARRYFGGGNTENIIQPGTYKSSGSGYYSQHYVDEYENYGEDTFEFFIDHTLTFTKTGKTYTCDAMLLIVDTGLLGSVATDGSWKEIDDYWGYENYRSSAEITISSAQTVPTPFYELFMSAFTLK